MRAAPHAAKPAFIEMRELLAAQGVWRAGIAMSHVEEAQRWRSLAAEAITRAQTLKDPEAKAVLLGIAERYDRLARQAEARCGEENSK